MAPVELFGAHVSVNLFTVLGVQAARGRTFRPEDSQLTNVSPIVVSERLVVGVASCVPGAVAVARWRGTLHDRTRGAARGRWDRSFMVVQVSLVFALGAQAVLVALVLQGLVRTNVGFTKTDFLVIKLQPRGAATIDTSVQLARYEALLGHLERQGIRAAAANTFPFTETDHLRTFEPVRSRQQVRTMARLKIVTPSYFPVTGLAATRGRVLTEADAGSRLVVVNDIFLASVLPSGTELGRRVGDAYEWTVVGVTRPFRHKSLHEEIPAEVYVLYNDLLEVAPTSASLSMRRVFILAETTRGVPATLQLIRTGCGSSSSTAQGASASGTARATWEPRRRRGGEGGLLTGRAISISVSLGVVPLVLPRRGSPITHRGRGWLRSTRSFRTASAPTKLATRRIRTRAWMKQRYWVAPACTSELHHGRGPGTARPFDDAGGDGTQAPPCRRTRPRG